MEKQLKDYQTFLTQQVDYFQRLTTQKTHLPGKLQELFLAYQNLVSDYRHRIRDFQHERLVHLLVTLFFALLLLTTFLLAITVGPFMARLSGAMWPTYILYALLVILLVVEVFYIKHYYFLENTIQKLYLLGNQLDNLYPNFEASEIEEKLVNERPAVANKTENIDDEIELIEFTPEEF